MDPTILTLSRFNDIFSRLWDSIVAHEGDARVRLVYDGVGLLGHDWGCCERLSMVRGEDPFVFARNTNIGMADIGPGRDVLLVNDDCQFTMPLLASLQAMAEKYSDFGLFSPWIAGHVGNTLQKARAGKDAYLPEIIPSIDPLCFVCIYIPWRTRKIIGNFDERFTGYGSEDLDYCKRVQNSGLSLAVCPQLVIQHGYGEGRLACSTSYLRQMSLAERDKSMAEMRKLFWEKHCQ